MGANAQTTVPTFTTGQVLTADQMNQSARTGVPVFADTTARDAGFGGSGEKVLAEGQLCYLENTDVVQYYDGAGWATVGPTTQAVVQVVSTFKDDTFITTSNTFVDVTGMSVSITPTSASNKVLVIAALAFGGAGGTQRGLRLMRDSTAIALGASAGGRTQAWYGHGDEPAGGLDSVTVVFLDSPATTSATTYKIQFQTNDSNNVTLNRTGSLAFYNSASTITVMEVKP